MEVLGALASSLQIVSLCGEVTLTIIRWIEAVKTVDERIDAFVSEVGTLRMTYESLSRSLKDPSMLEAARITNRDVGGHLWTQMSRTLRDCEATMNSITAILRKIQSSNSVLRPVMKQLRESLHTGDLSRLREQVIMFNSSLQLPMQMMTLTIQLRQHEMTTAHQLHLNEQLALLSKGIERIQQMSKAMIAPRRSESFGGSTRVDDSSSNKAWFENMEDYVGTAKKFLESASVAASSLSASSVNNPDDDSHTAYEGRRGSSFVPLSLQKLKSIGTYVEDLVPPPDSGAGSGTPLPSDDHSDTELRHATLYDSDEEADDIDLQLLQALLQNGGTELARSNYAGAEENYREALLVSQNNSFTEQTACSTADIALMLADCLVKQEKYDDTIELLRPLAGFMTSPDDNPQSSGISTLSSSQVDTDKGQMLAANHLLGKTYLQKGNYNSAEKCCVLAFKGRKKLLGESHPKTIESIHLVIEMYKAKGQNARAEAHRIFLKPVDAIHAAAPRSISSSTPSPSSSDPISIPHSGSPVRSRRSNFNFTSPFRRAEKFGTPPTSMPTGNGPQMASSPHRMGDEFHHLSISSNDTSCLHIDSDNAHQIRRRTANSNSSSADLPNLTSGGNPTSQQLTHQRIQSFISKTPTIYASMSPAEMEQRFLEVSMFGKQGKTNKAVENGMSLLQQYDPKSSILIHRTSELKDTIKRSKAKGLAGTGYGFAPLHFFCSLKYEASMEVDILLRHNADPNAVAYKAGYGKTDPFVPLSLAVDRGHANIVRLLLERGATWQAERMRTGSRFRVERDGMHPLLQACQKSYVNIVDVFLEHDVALTEDLFPRQSWHGNSLLHEASYRCDLELVRLIMKHARRKGLLYDSNYTFIGNPSQQDEFGMTPIMHAVDMRDYSEKLRAAKSRDRIACLRLLLELDGDTGRAAGESTASSRSRRNSPGTLATGLHIQDKKGNTVYWYADEARGGDAELTAFLDEQSQRSRLIDI